MRRSMVSANDSRHDGVVPGEQAQQRALAPFRDERDGEQRYAEPEAEGEEEQHLLRERSRAEREREDAHEESARARQRDRPVHQPVDVCGARRGAAGGRTGQHRQARERVSAEDQGHAERDDEHVGDRRHEHEDLAHGERECRDERAERQHHREDTREHEQPEPPRPSSSARTAGGEVRQEPRVERQGARRERREEADAEGRAELAQHP